MNTFKISIQAIMLNKVRAFLTMLGVIIGVFSVVMLTALGYGLQSYINDQFESLGANTVFVSVGQVFGENGSFETASEKILSVKRFKVADVNDIKKLREYVSNVSYFITSIDQVKFLKNEERATILGTVSEYPDVINIDIAKGRFFDKGEEKSGEKVVCVGYGLAEDLFGKVDPINKKIKIGTQTFKVIGVAEEQGGSFGGPSFDEYIYAPFEIISKIYDQDDLTEFAVKIKDAEQIDPAMEAIEEELAKNYDEDDFTVFDQSTLLSTITGILSMLTIALGGIAAISLLVGGIGIMNIMLVSVTERTREIGLRKALGATPNMILRQFLIEASLLSVLGGLVGLLLAVLGVWALQSVFPAKITSQSVILALGVSTAVGLIFGVAPAKRAAKLSPIEALRYE
jgi:putative ABC transport system permease protein